MNFVFFGTSRFSTLVLDELGKAGYVPELIVTLPDALVGRKQVLTPPPVKIWAHERNIPIAQPTKLTPDILSHAYDLFVVASYGKIIPQNVLAIPTKGTLNVHPSLLPHYRGPTPIQTAILHGEHETGVTIMLLDPEMDHGPILTSQKVEVKNQNYLELETELAGTGGKLLAEVIPEWVDGTIEAVEQDHSEATFTTKFESRDGFIDSYLITTGCLEHRASPCPDLTLALRKVRALNPEPGTWTTINDQRIKILSAMLQNDRLVPEDIVPAGKNEMRWEEFVRGKKR